MQPLERADSVAAAHVPFVQRNSLHMARADSMHGAAAPPAAQPVYQAPNLVPGAATAARAVQQPNARNGGQQMQRALTGWHVEAVRQPTIAPVVKDGVGGVVLRQAFRPEHSVRAAVQARPGSAPSSGGGAGGSSSMHGARAAATRHLAEGRSLGAQSHASARGPWKLDPRFSGDDIEVPVGQHASPTLSQGAMGSMNPPDLQDSWFDETGDTNGLDVSELSVTGTSSSRMDVRAPISVGQASLSSWESSSASRSKDSFRESSSRWRQVTKGGEKMTSKSKELQRELLAVEKDLQSTVSMQEELDSHATVALENLAIEREGMAKRMQDALNTLKNLEAEEARLRSQLNDPSSETDDPHSAVQLQSANADTMASADDFRIHAREDSNQSSGVTESSVYQSHASERTIARLDGELSVVLEDEESQVDNSCEEEEENHCHSPLKSQKQPDLGAVTPTRKQFKDPAFGSPISSSRSSSRQRAPMINSPGSPAVKSPAAVARRRRKARQAVFDDSSSSDSESDARHSMDMSSSVRSSTDDLWGRDSPSRLEDSDGSVAQLTSQEITEHGDNDAKQQAPDSMQIAAGSDLEWLYALFKNFWCSDERLVEVQHGLVATGNIECAGAASRICRGGLAICTPRHVPVLTWACGSSISSASVRQKEQGGRLLSPLQTVRCPPESMRHRDITVCCSAHSNVGSVMACAWAGDEGCVAIWSLISDARKGKGAQGLLAVHAFEGRVSAMSADIDSSTLFVATKIGALCELSAFDWMGRKLLCKLSLSATHSPLVLCSCCDAQNIWLGTQCGLWYCSRMAGGQLSPPQRATLGQGGQGVLDVVLLGSSRHVVAAAGSDVIALKGSSVWRRERHGPGVSALASVPQESFEGPALLSASGACCVLWDSSLKQLERISVGVPAEICLAAEYSFGHSMAWLSFSDGGVRCVKLPHFDIEKQSPQLEQQSGHVSLEMGSYTSSPLTRVQALDDSEYVVTVDNCGALSIYSLARLYTPLHTWYFSACQEGQSACPSLHSVVVKHFSQDDTASWAAIRSMDVLWTMESGDGAGFGRRIHAGGQEYFIALATEKSGVLLVSLPSSLSAIEDSSSVDSCLVCESFVQPREGEYKAVSLARVDCPVARSLGVRPGEVVCACLHISGVLDLVALPTSSSGRGNDGTAAVQGRKLGMPLRGIKLPAGITSLANALVHLQWSLCSRFVRVILSFPPHALARHAAASSNSDRVEYSSQIVMWNAGSRRCVQSAVADWPVALGTDPSSFSAMHKVCHGVSESVNPVLVASPVPFFEFRPKSRGAVGPKNISGGSLGGWLKGENSGKSSPVLSSCQVFDICAHPEEDLAEEGEVMAVGANCGLSLWRLSSSV